MKASKIHSKTPVVLFILWLFVQACVWNQFGILTKLEAGKYIREANNIFYGRSLSTDGFTFYLLEILLIAAFKLLKVNIAYVIVLHLLINACATNYLWKILNGLTNYKIATITTALFIAFIPVQQFNFQLQTESLFISLIIFHAYFAIECAKGNKKAIVGLMIIQTLLVFSRPAGVLWTIPTTLSVFHLIRLEYKKNTTRAIGICLLALSLVAIEFVVGKSSQFNLIKPLQNGHVICGIPTEEPNSLSVSESDPRSVFTPLSFILENFRYFLTISAKKTISFFGLCRSYYSPMHNALLLLFIIPVYVFAVIGLLVASKKELSLFSIPIAGIATTYVMVLLTCDDWHNRFSLSILSLLLILCSRGIYWTNARLKKKTINQLNH